MSLPEGYEVLHHAGLQQPWTLARRRNAPGGTHKGWARHHEVLYFCFTKEEAQTRAEFIERIRGIAHAEVV